MLLWCANGQENSKAISCEWDHSGIKMNDRNTQYQKISTYQRIWKSYNFKNQNPVLDHSIKCSCNNYKKNKSELTNLFKLKVNNEISANLVNVQYFITYLSLTLTISFFAIYSNFHTKWCCWNKWNSQIFCKLWMVQIEMIRNRIIQVFCLFSKRKNCNQELCVMLYNFTAWFGCA